MRARLQVEIDIPAPAATVWDYVTDWPRQGDWVPMTRVVRVDEAAGVGGRFRAWTGFSRVGFWDPMTITAWEREPDDGGRCEVLHTGRVVKGEGEFTVLSLGPERSRFVWAELLVVPLGPVGAWGWPVARPVVERLIHRGLRSMRDQVEQASAQRPS